MKREETAIDKIANDWVKQLAKRSPSYATYLGFPGGEKDVDDFSPDALEQDRHDYADLISRLQAEEPVDEVDRVTKEAMKHEQHCLPSSGHQRYLRPLPN
jgi:hypothetical protein